MKGRYKKYIACFIYKLRKVNGIKPTTNKPKSIRLLMFVIIFLVFLYSFCHLVICNNIHCQTSVADFVIESIYDLQGKNYDERINSPIKNLRKRFDDVCSWTTYIVLSHIVPDERRAAFACLLRVAVTCWNIGNFIGAKEIITGLR
jgi:hypothetical protein